MKNSTKTLMPAMQGLILPFVSTGRKVCLMRRLLCIALVLSLAAAWCVGGASAEGRRIKAYGSLSSVESDRLVYINNQGYMTDPDLKVVNNKKQRCSLDDLKLPTKVYFEFVYTSQEPVIKLIKDLPR